jgi:hypothetical protein
VQERQAERAAKLRPLLAMVREREELRLKMVEFEQRASDKSRLYARGTKLLEEERFRKHVAVNYPKIIRKLNKAIAAWEEEEETDFFYQVSVLLAPAPLRHLAAARRVSVYTTCGYGRSGQSHAPFLAPV